MSGPYQPNDDPTRASSSDWSSDPPPPTPYQPNDDPTIFSQIEPTSMYSPSPYWEQPAQPPPAGQAPPGYPMGSPYAPEYGPSPMPAAPRPARRPHRWRWMACGVILGVVLVPCVCLGAIAGYFLVQATGAGSTLNTFCADLKSQRYADAYTLLAPIYQVRVSRSQFVASSQALDRREGAVTACNQPHPSFTLDNNSVTLVVAIAHSRSATTTGDVSLIKSGGKWRIATLDPRLGYPS